MKRIAIIALALLALALVPITGADAGVGPSQHCSDGGVHPGATEIPIIGDPVTLGLEVGVGGNPVVMVCYSTTPFGDGGTAITGGHATLFPLNDLWCRWDNNTAIGTGCYVSWGSTIAVIIDPRVQSNSGWIGVTATGIRGPACIDDLRLYHRTGVVGPYDVGVC